jgi:hypothetical protein
MKKIYTTLSLILGLSMAINAQCVIDNNNKAFGITPDDLGVSCVGKPINKVVQIAIPNDTTVEFNGFLVPISFDSVYVTADPNTIPAGLNYQCANGCKFYRNQTGDYTRGCITISGTPTTVSAANDMISVNAQVFSSLGDYNYPFELAVNVLAANDAKCINGLSDFKIASSLDIYPNPSKGSATINLDLPSATKVKIDIYGVLGNKIVALYNGKMAQGLNSVSTLSGTLLESGMYMIKIDIDTDKGTRTYTERMVVR